MRDGSRRRRPRWRRPLAVTLGAVVALVAAGGGVAWAMSGRTADRYTTAAVTMGSVRQTVSATGTVASATRRDVSFPVAGTVKTVAVGLGDAVTAGEVLATLDPTSLQATLDQASTALQQAQQTLSDDLASQTASSTSSTASAAGSSASSSSSSSAASRAGQGSSSSGAAGSSGSTTQSSAAVQKAAGDVTTAQKALLAAYDAAHTALGTSTRALSDAQAACTAIDHLDPATVVADAGGTPTSSPTAPASPDPTPSVDPTPSAGPTPTGTPTPTPVSAVQALITACQGALSSASDAQAATKTAQQAVSDAATVLDKAVAALQAALGSSGSGSGGSPTGGPGAQPTSTPTATATPTPTVAPASSTSGAGSSASRSSSSVSSATAKVATAADVLADRAAIDAAQAKVDIATHDLTLVDLTSPVDGTVGAVSLTVGAGVSASSTSAVVTVLGNGGHVVNLTVPLSSLTKLAVGQPATVVVPSTTTALTGKVSSIGVLDVSSTSTPAYSVVVALDATTERLFDGSSAQVSIAVAATGQVLTVPTSAVHVTGSTATVQVLQNGAVSDVVVQRGAVGAELTEVASGLTEGQTVVLADRSQPLQTGSTSSTSGLSGLTSGTTTRGGAGVGFPAGGAFPGRG